MRPAARCNLRCLPDGRWFDATGPTWRNRRGRPARWPDLVETAQIRQTRVVLAAAHLDHDPRNNRLRNLKSLCQRCHMIHDRPHHLAQRRITYLLRRAVGDLFLGPYSAWLVQQPAQFPGRPNGMQGATHASAMAWQTSMVPQAGCSTEISTTPPLDLRRFLE